MRIFKKILKILGSLMLLAVVLAGAFFVHVWYFKPFSINLFFGREALQFALESPEMLSSIHILEQFGIDGHNAELDDESIASGDRLFARLKKAHATLVSYEDEDLSAADPMSKEIMLALLDMGVEAERFRYHNYPLNQMFGAQNGFPSFMESTHQVHNVGDAEDYVTRLSKVGVKFDQVLEGLRHREEIGVLPPQFVIDKVLEEMRNFVATPVEENILFAALTKKMEEAELAEDQQRRVGLAARQQIEATVYPAYGRFIAYFEERIAPSSNPRTYGKSLESSFSGLWRYRIGDYRAICRIEDAHMVVLVVRISHRSKVYKKPLK